MHAAVSESAACSRNQVSGWALVSHGEAAGAKGQSLADKAGAVRPLTRRAHGGETVKDDADQRCALIQV